MNTSEASGASEAFTHRDPYCKTYGIGEAAKILGVSGSRLRNGDLDGTLPDPARDARGYRYYTEADIKHLKALGVGSRNNPTPGVWTWHSRARALTDEDVHEIDYMHLHEGYSYYRLAKSYEVSVHTIKKALRREGAYKEVPY